MQDPTSSQQLIPKPTDQAPAISKSALPEIFRPTPSDAALREAAMSARPAIIIGLTILGVFSVLAFAWIMYVPVTANIHVTGELVFQTKRQTVQHLEGGIVKEILVHDGDIVKAGQPLVRLESNQVQPLVNMLDEQGLAEVAYMARVEAESKDLGSIRFPNSLTSRAKDPAISRIMQTEEKLFVARRVAFQNQVQMMQLQIAQLRESTKGTQERLATKKQEIALLREQLEANQALQKQGYVTNSLVMDYQRSLAAQTGDLNMIAAAIASDRQRKSELEQRIFALKAERIQGAVNEMKQSSMRRIDQQEKVRPLRDTLERQTIRAPITGKVVGLRVTTIGGVLMPREAMCEITPTEDHLILEAKIRLEDISEVKVGQIADVGINGVRLLTRPDVKARIKYISDDRIMGGPGQPPYYPAQLEFDQKSLKTLGDTPLRAGRTAAISIASKPHTPMTDMVESIHDHFLKAQASRATQ